MGEPKPSRLRVLGAHLVMLATVPRALLGVLQGRKGASRALRMSVMIAFGVVISPLTSVANLLRKATGRPPRTQPVLGGVYSSLVSWAMSPPAAQIEQLRAMADTEPDRYMMVDMGIGGQALLDRSKANRWSDSMCLHCIHGGTFPECPNEHAGAGFSKEVGPMICQPFEEAG